MVYPGQTRPSFLPLCETSDAFASRGLPNAMGCEDSKDSKTSANSEHWRRHLQDLLWTKTGLDWLRLWRCCPPLKSLFKDRPDWCRSKSAACASSAGQGLAGGSSSGQYTKLNLVDFQCMVLWCGSSVMYTHTSKYWIYIEVQWIKWLIQSNFYSKS